MVAIPRGGFTTFTCYPVGRYAGPSFGSALAEGRGRVGWTPPGIGPATPPRGVLLSGGQSTHRI